LPAIDKGSGLIEPLIRGTLIMRLLISLLLLLAFATPGFTEKGPDQRPYLRIEAGMHTASIKRIGLSADGGPCLRDD
jgi:hypothetical protein